MFDQGPDNEQYTGQRFPADSRCSCISSNSYMDNDMDNNKILVHGMNRLVLK